MTPSAAYIAIYVTITAFAMGARGSLEEGMQRPSIANICAAAGLGAFTGAIAFGFALSLWMAIDTGRIDNVGWAIALIPLALLVSVFTAWPLGILLAVPISILAGINRWTTALVGLLTGLAIFYIVFGGFSGAEQFSFLAAMAGAFVIAGLAGGLAAFRALDNRGGGFNRDRYP